MMVKYVLDWLVNVLMSYLEFGKNGADRLFRNKFTHNFIIHPVEEILPWGLGEMLHNWHADWVWG